LRLAASIVALPFGPMEMKQANAAFCTGRLMDDYFAWMLRLESQTRRSAKAAMCFYVTGSNMTYRNLLTE
jgi:hypothetical protein